MKYFFSLIISIFFFGHTYSQNNQWGILLNSEEAVEGYTLFKISGEDTYLIDNCGEVVHTWDNTGGLFNHPKLLPNGNIIYMNDFEIWELNWEGDELNSIKLDQSGIEGLRYRYEVIKLENGNYLSVGRLSKSAEELDDLGFDLTLNNPVQTDVVVEIDSASGSVVWLWDIADHMIQERDTSKGNFGSISDHPELLNADAIYRFDWTGEESFMINGIDYHPELDQIALSVRKMSEVIIIDHSTTTEEAQGSAGGNSGKGGDILYRWGNPQNYNRGTESDRFLFFQHNPKWILEGPNKNKLTCFNNGLDRDGSGFQSTYSQAPIINTPINAAGQYELADNTAFLPSTPEIVYSGDNPNSAFYSPYTSGANVYANGNVFISEGVNARLLEVNLEGEVVWEYKVPANDYLFRAEKYPSAYPAFATRDLSPTGFEIPFVNTEYECDLSTSLGNLRVDSNIFSLDQTDNKSYTINNLRNTNIQFQLVDLQGKIWDTYSLGSLGSQNISLNRLAPSIYILSAIDQTKGQIQSQKLAIY